MVADACALVGVNTPPPTGTTYDRDRPRIRFGHRIFPVTGLGNSVPVPDIAAEIMGAVNGPADRGSATPTWWW